jgi:hypothetical protein
MGVEDTAELALLKDDLAGHVELRGPTERPVEAPRGVEVARRDRDEVQRPVHASPVGRPRHRCGTGSFRPYVARWS